MTIARFSVIIISLASRNDAIEFRSNLIVRMSTETTLYMYTKVISYKYINIQKPKEGIREEEIR